MAGAVSNEDGPIGSMERTPVARIRPKAGECGNLLLGHPDPGAKRAYLANRISKEWNVETPMGSDRGRQGNPVGQYPNRKEWETPQREQERPRSECHPLTGWIGPENRRYPG